MKSNMAFIAVNFPSLVVASVKYMKKFGSETFKFMATTIVTTSGLVNKAITKNDKDIYIKAKEKTLSANAIQGINVQSSTGVSLTAKD